MKPKLVTCPLDRETASGFLYCLLLQPQLMALQPQQEYMRLGFAKRQRRHFSER